LRLEQGIPTWGAELSTNTLPPEAGPHMLAAISYTKGCYVGQETIARLKSVGHVNRTLVFLESDSAKIPATGAKLLQAEKELGLVTSSGFSPRLRSTPGCHGWRFAAGRRFESYDCDSAFQQGLTLPGNAQESGPDLSGRIGVLGFADFADALDLLSGRIEPAENISRLDLQLRGQFLDGNARRTRGRQCLE
jgi:folate-binding protein YgfZ